MKFIIAFIMHRLLKTHQKNLCDRIFQIILDNYNYFTEITILHLWIHSLTYVLRIAVHLRCGHLLYDETAEVKADCDRALREIQQVTLHY